MRHFYKTIGIDTQYKIHFYTRNVSCIAKGFTNVPKMKTLEKNTQTENKNLYKYFRGSNSPHSYYKAVRSEPLHHLCIIITNNNE